MSQNNANVTVISINLDLSALLNAVFEEQSGMSLQCEPRPVFIDEGV